MTSRFLGWRERVAAYKSKPKSPRPSLGWRNFEALHGVNVYKNTSIANRFPNKLPFNVGPGEHQNAWANNAKGKVVLANVLARHPGKTRANLYGMYLQNLEVYRRKQAPARNKLSALERLINYEKKKPNNLPRLRKFKLKNDGTWKEVDPNNYVDKKYKVMRLATNRHLEAFPYLRQLVLRKNSTRTKGLPIGNWYYIPHENLENYGNIKRMNMERKQRLRKTRGETAAFEKLSQVYNVVRRRQHARNRGRVLGETLKNIWNMRHGKNIVPPGPNMSKRTKPNSPAKAAVNNAVNKQLENLRKEHSRLVAEARQTASAHNAGTWARTASGGLKLKKN